MPTPQEILLRLYNQRPEDFGEVLTGDPGSAPAGLAGLVMNPKNAKVIAGKMANFIMENAGKRFNNADYVIEYLKAKYPKLASIPVEYNTRARLGNRTLGLFDPFSKGVAVNYKFANRTTPELVSTLTHEIVHALQNKKGETFKVYQQAGRANKNFLNYFQQPVEQQARQGGLTARNTFEKFLNLIK